MWYQRYQLSGPLPLILFFRTFSLLPDFFWFLLILLLPHYLVCLPVCSPPPCQVIVTRNVTGVTVAVTMTMVMAMMMTMTVAVAKEIMTG